MWNEAEGRKYSSGKGMEKDVVNLGGWNTVYMERWKENIEKKQEREQKECRFEKRKSTVKVEKKQVKKKRSLWNEGRKIGEKLGEIGGIRDDFGTRGRGSLEAPKG